MKHFTLTYWRTGLYVNFDTHGNFSSSNSKIVSWLLKTTKFNACSLYDMIESQLRDNSENVKHVILKNPNPSEKTLLDSNQFHVFRRLYPDVACFDIGNRRILMCKGFFE